jgi:hypothetical protein
MSAKCPIRWRFHRASTSSSVFFTGSQVVLLAVVMTAQIVAVNADDDPALADHTTNHNYLISVHCPFSPGIRKEPKKEKPPRISRWSWLAGTLVFPATSSPSFPGPKAPYKVGFLSSGAMVPKKSHPATWRL